MTSKIILYCQKTLIDLKIAERFYVDMHYCWVTTEFDKKDNPTSSNPKKRYEILKNDVDSGDLDSLMIKQNKSGMKNGANKLRLDGIISVQQESEIIDIIDGALINHFKPKILVIPYDLVKLDLRPVSPNKRANTLSDEYIIEKLSRDKFDIIEF
jgi:hypothetical protein